jgi:hypothetical protein
MDPISNVDRLVLLLRQRLSERSAVASRGAAARRTQPAAPDAVRALAAVEGMDERHLRRALIQSLLADSFGRQVVNEAQFQQVVDRVTQTIEEDPDTVRLLQRVVGDLRTAAR